jgi:hypothetical protein
MIDNDTCIKTAFRSMETSEIQVHVKIAYNATVCYTYKYESH